MNGFRIAGDLIHLAAIISLLVKICLTRSCAGISGKSQLLLAISFTARHIDVLEFISSFHRNEVLHSYMEVLFSVATYAICSLIFIKYKNTYDRNYDTVPILFVLLPPAMLALFVNYRFAPFEVTWAFSIFLESVATIPQLVMTRNIKNPNRDIVLYLLALFLYRAIYIPSWVNEGRCDIINTIAVTVQLTLHWDFLYLYIMTLVGMWQDVMLFITLIFTLRDIKKVILCYQDRKKQAIEDITAEDADNVEKPIAV